MRITVDEAAQSTAHASNPLSTSSLIHHHIIQYTPLAHNTMASPTNDPLTAQYNSSASPSHTFSHDLPSCPTNPTTDLRITYLSSLRSGVSHLQGQVNTFLTQKMERDKNQTSQPTRDEEKEEENYGEEIID
jgi:hypothetical protein